MRKNITIVNCDDCNKKLEENTAIHFLGHDFCKSCLFERIKVSKTVYKIGKADCKFCEGKGWEENRGMYGYNSEICKNCNGSGKVYQNAN